ncbi:MAG TPA: hypothetical protein P5114_10040, partial [Hyphomicrobiaceae bacterium]|nr:hypothetical protein [Hyphomicrobiaceae bacterium]
MTTRTNTKPAITRRHRGVIVGIATACAFYTLHSSAAHALDIDGTDGLITQTVASRENLRDYDNIKKYGAERVGDRDHAMPHGLRMGNYTVLPSLGATVVFDDNIYRSDRNK